MSRVQLDKTAYRTDTQGRLSLGSGKPIVAIYEQNADGSDGAAASVYTTKAGGTLVTFPAQANAQGRYQLFVDPGEYNIHDADGDVFPWQAVSAAQLGGLELGRAVKSDANATATSTYTTYTDITGLSITVDVEAGQDITLEFFTGGVFNPTGTTLVIVLAIREGSTVLCEVGEVGRSTAAGPTVTVRSALSPSEGSHTYKASLTRLTASGTATAVFSSVTPGHLIARSA